jgi:hypothetical protein
VEERGGSHVGGASGIEVRLIMLVYVEDLNVWGNGNGNRYLAWSTASDVL